MFRGQRWNTRVGFDFDHHGWIHSSKLIGWCRYQALNYNKVPLFFFLVSILMSSVRRQRSPEVPSLEKSLPLFFGARYFFSTTTTTTSADGISTADRSIDRNRNIYIYIVVCCLGWTVSKNTSEGQRVGGHNALSSVSLCNVKRGLERERETGRSNHDCSNR